ncbi:MAG: hypothetical protein AAGH64_07180, partial [Planctomycetota bacterium]
MTARPLVLGVGHAPVLMEARRDVRLELRRCEDALDALALACTLPSPPIALVLDHDAAQREDLPEVIDAARLAGLPEPFILPPDDDGASLWDLLHAERQPDRSPAVGHAAGATGAIIGAIESLLDGELALGAFLEGCAAIGVRLLDDPAGEPAHAPVLDADGDAIAHIAGPGELRSALPQLARACAAIAGLDEAFEDLLEDASTDRHTGLPDREALLDELQARIDEARPARREFALTLARLEPDAWDDAEDLHAIAQDAGFAAITSWGVVAILGSPEFDTGVLDAGPF